MAPGRAMAAVDPRAGCGMTIKGASSTRRRKPSRVIAPPLEMHFPPARRQAVARFATGLAAGRGRPAAKPLNEHEKTGGERGIRIESQDTDLLDFCCIREFRYHHFVPTIGLAARSALAEIVIS